MNRKIILLMVLILALLFPEGCWSRREINELAIVLGAGLDRTADNKVQLTLQLARPSAFSGGGENAGGEAPRQNNSWVVTGTGDTVLDAENNLALKVSRHIYWSHSIIIVYGESMARGGVRDVSNFFMRNPQPRETSWIFVTEGEAKNVLESHSELEKTSAQSIAFLARNQPGYSIMLEDFQQNLTSPGTNPAAPRIQLLKLGQPQGVGMEERLRHEEVGITGTGIFKDDKLVGWLDMSETRGLLWLHGKVKEGAIIVPSPGQPDKKISLAISRDKIKVNPEYDGETVKFNVNIEFDMELLEQQSNEDLTQPEKIKEIERLAAEEVLEQCNSALAKAQGDYGTDIFGFGEAFHRKYKTEWKKVKGHWNDEFQKARVDIAVEPHLRLTGMLHRRASLKR
ncbi:spore germination protein GerKC [Desulfocucumis palustris]|uniref:Spore germination protein GerKC n=1 Tax=Desulfocucumis palustris TaxID=1898651 RepID=A0A2L2XG71_9FIRM|nr:Ger(x)C family spore germination protein [Desulfocucumis palustris]GBF35205.1 spore germination protein GerKC [Desulfocucumis palustris]